MQPLFGRRRARTGRGSFFATLGLLAVLFGADSVFAFPQIVVQPASASVASGTPVTFSVGITQLTNSMPPLSVLWRRNGANLPGTLANFTITNVGEVVFSTLTISNAEPTNAGSYFAVAFDSEGAVNTTNASLSLTDLSPLPVGDLFTNRGSITGYGGTGVADNFASTNEPGTPSNDNIPGGAMVWLEWTAPDTGVVTFDTGGSDFDTTLGIYQISTNNNSAPVVTNLVALGGDDDAKGYFNSAVSFNVSYGAAYEIGVDGYYGSHGHIVLNWSLQTGGLIPPILQQPVSQTVLSNASAFLSVAVDTNVDSSPVLYQWYFNGARLTNAAQSSMTISNVLPGTVGQYSVLAQFSDQASNFTVLSEPAQIQINVQGNTRDAAAAKLHQEADPNSYPGGPVPLITALAAGFTGTQIYNTFASAEEPGEPDHCGKVGGSPYWFSCQATNTGTLTADAYTPTYTNVLAVYTWPGGASYSTLVPVACASTNAGVGHEKVVFPAANGTVYYLVVDGLNEGYGQVTLNLSFVAPPTIITNPQSQTVPQGSSPTLTAAAIGTPSPVFQWRTNKMAFGGQNGAGLTIANFQAVNQGAYDVIVTNLVGSATSSVAMLYLDSPLRLTNTVLTTTNSFNFLLLGKGGTNYIFQASTNLATTNWVSIFTNSSPYGVLSYADTNQRHYPYRFFRAIVKTN